MPTAHSPLVVVEKGPNPAPRATRLRLALALGVASVSDILSLLTTFAPPVQWALDLGTAVALFLILGARWAILPGLIVEAIPGMGVFPMWILVVVSIGVYDNVRTNGGKGRLRDLLHLFARKNK